MKKSTKRALLTSVMALLLCFSMLLGTTFAWFTDSVESGNNVIKAGNLDVEFEYWKDGAYHNVDGATDIFDPNALWEPGHAEVAYLKVSNAGTLALKYRMALSVLGNTIGKTKTGAEIDLTKYINFAIVENVAANAYGTGDAGRDAAIEAAENATRNSQAVGAHSFSEVLDSDADTHGWLNREGKIIKAAEGQEETVHTFAIVVWMPNTVGNEANHDGVNIPYINLGLSVIATQVENEEDSFGPDFDAGLGYPTLATGTVTVNPNHDSHFGEVRDNNGSKVASFNVPTNAIAPDAKNVTVSVEETKVNPNVTVQAGEEAKTYEVTVSGLVSGNTELIEFKLRVPAGLDPDTVKLYHYEDEVTDARYNPNDGYVTFKTASFSPFTVVYDAESKYEAPSADGLEAPKATVTYLGVNAGEDTIEWGNIGGFHPTEGLDSTLEATFKFACPENLDPAVMAAYEYWYCDFFVSLDRDLGENEIFLGGNYGDFGWIGFHNGDLTLPKDYKLPLLCSVTTNPWTYSDIENYVGEFICGVGDVDNALEDATFTVSLRLINPEKVDTTVDSWWENMSNDAYVDVNVVTYTFGGDYNIQ